jgi:hypothetical protein
MSIEDYETALVRLRRRNANLQAQLDADRSDVAPVPDHEPPHHDNLCGPHCLKQRDERGGPLLETHCRRCHEEYDYAMVERPMHNPRPRHG